MPEPDPPAAHHPPDPPAPPEPQKRRKANADEAALSNSLIAGAFGFIGIALLVAPQFADKVEPGSLRFGAILSALACGLLIASIMVGGTAQRRVTPGKQLNGFAVQALLGLLAVIALVGTGLIYGLNPKADDAALSKRLTSTEQELKALKLETTARLAAAEARLALLERHALTCAAVARPPPKRPSVPPATAHLPAKPCPIAPLTN